MNMFRTLFAMFTSLFTTVHKVTKTLDIVVDQTSYGLVQARDDAAKALITHRQSIGITQEDINQLNKDIFG